MEDAITKNITIVGCFVGVDELVFDADVGREFSEKGVVSSALFGLFR